MTLAARLLFFLAFSGENPSGHGGQGRSRIGITAVPGDGREAPPLFPDFDGVDGTAVGGPGGPVVLGLVGLRQDGGDPVLHAEDAGGGVGTHAAPDAGGGVHSDSHGKSSYYNKNYGESHGSQPCLFPHCCQSC